MKAEEQKREQYIFYLQLTTKLVNNFFDFNCHLTKQNIFLIPINDYNLRELNRKKNAVLLAIIRDLESLKKYNEIKNKFLYSAVKNQQVRLFEISSFAEDSILCKSTYQENYRYYQLPINLNIINEDILQFFNDGNKAFEAWPGGKRGKFPIENAT